VKKVDRREMLRLSSCTAAAAAFSTLASGKGFAASGGAGHAIERWDFVEIDLAGPTAGNPFLDVELTATFRFGNRDVVVHGFYDGAGVYKVRFMPDETGEWTYVTSSNASALNGKKGAFRCVPSSGDNHGPVLVRDSYHFGYADGTPYVQCGTTCYAWAFQPEQIQQQTLQTLAASPFNKLRMCIFPKWYAHNHSEPPMYPFPRNGETNDYSTFNPEYFRNFDQLIAELRRLNEQADLILFHPYDKWGYQAMPSEVDDRYLRYVAARFSAYRNVWWSLANEYDLMNAKTSTDWDRFGRTLQQCDPYGHLRSVHNCVHMYEYGRGWCTHAGIQSSEFTKTAEWRADWRKPLIYDECQYEGNIAEEWGNITGGEMTRRFWLAAVQGAYCGHGETYLNENDVLWWSHGGVLHGSSPAQIMFLRKLLEESIAIGPGPIGFSATRKGSPLSAKRENNAVVFYYFDLHRPAEATLTLPEGLTYTAEFIDTLKMTRTPLPGTHTGKASLRLPGTPYGAVWSTAVQYKKA
jgi:hypothetical protein